MVNVRRRKNNLPCYGKLLCSHLESISCKYKPCPKAGCILFGVVSIAKEIVKDLLELAQVDSKIKSQPTRDGPSKQTESYYQKKIATYLLFVMQECNCFQFLEEKKDNILYQCGYGDVTLTEVLGVTKEDALSSLPYWIQISRMSRTQLLLLVRDLHIELPSKCSATRNALCAEVIKTYKEWEKFLKDDKTKKKKSWYPYLVRYLIYVTVILSKPNIK